ncbi:outer membrane usher protein PefC [Salmonella enterica subsp. enterica]|nr:outer membrane usher protein PefC [Salmonella enterica subsp. enterica]EBN1739990.1 outer membrane usher protein PefC [Salmonella enterica subsp. enterica]EGL4889331.1 PefC/AfrB family outer membrane usher protein [Salmonella enterica]EJU7766025.1 PefC/AfrB family outer membrane usher protein [Salmonella enterica subsp. enterica serovar 6,14:a:1,7]EKH1725861.1 PefC/AfrB family outer membrane usher protein [Salmonella enterica]
MFKKKILLLLICSALQPVFNVMADDEFNLSFIRGGAQGKLPEIFDKNVNFVPGEYLVDVEVNGEKVSNGFITVTENEKKNLCLTKEWLTEQSVFIKDDFYEKEFDSTKKCYVLGNNETTKVELDNGTQTLKFGIPQAALVSGERNQRPWDYGDPGFQLAYSANTSKSSGQKRTNYLGMNGSANLGKWVLSLTANATDENGFSTNDLRVTRALESIKADLSIGQAQSNYSPLMNGFSFRGVQLNSNANMSSWLSRTYAPRLQGIATSNARVTIEQNGRVLESVVVPPGPFEISNLGSISSGDLVMTITEENGSKRSERFPVTVMSNLLRPGALDYGFAVGKKISGKNKSSSDGTFTLGRLDYGFNYVTFNSALLFSQNYQNIGIGSTHSLGWFGALSTSVNLSKAQYKLREEQKGYSASVKYARSLSNTTDLQLIGYRFTDRGYVEYASYNYLSDRSGGYKSRNRYEAILAHRVPGQNIYLSMSGWMQQYWDKPQESGLNFMLSKSFNRVSASLSGNYSKKVDGSGEYMTSLSLNIPFSAFDVMHYSNTAMTYTREGGMSYMTGSSANINDRLSYNMSMNRDKNGNNMSLSTGYAADYAQLTSMYSKGSDSQNLSLQMSGSVLGVYGGGLMLSQNSGGTLAVIDMDGISGAVINGGLPTDSSGRAVISLASYSPNSINIDVDNLPTDIEVQGNVINVVPTEKAIIYRKIKYRRVQHFILRVFGKNKYVVPMGTIAKDDAGREVGFVSNGGVLLLNVDSKVKKITLDQCAINLNKISPTKKTIQEIYCE